MSKHTPGPWVVHPTSIHPAVRSIGTAEAGPRRICTVGSTNGNPTDWHNARLIAAAPELLEALERIANGPWPDWINCPEAQCRFDEQIARAAIAKATGEQV